MPHVDAPIEELRDVRHAVRTKIRTHLDKARREKDARKRDSHYAHVERLARFLDRLPDTKYGR